MKKSNKKRKLSELVELDKKIRQLPKLSKTEEQMLESEELFDATFYSNKLEGNKLSKSEARKAVLSE